MTRKRAKKLLMAMGYSRNFAEWALRDRVFRPPNAYIVHLGETTRQRVFQQYFASRVHLFPVGRVSINFIAGLGCKPQLTFIIYGTNPW